MRVARKLKLWMVTPELYGIKKTGGLADAVAGLSEGLARRGHEIAFVMPKHGGTLEHFLRAGFSLSHLTTLQVPMGETAVKTDAFYASIEDGSFRLNFFFIDTDKSSLFGNRNAPYGYADDPYRYFFFDRAVCQLLQAVGPGIRTRYGETISPPDILHGHDWQTGYTPFFLKRHPDTARAPFVYSIHNLGYGFGSRLSLGEFSLLANLPISQNPALFSWDKGLEFYGQIDPHKTAILSSDRIVTVSPQYAREIIAGTTPEPGNRYHGILQTKKEAVSGILNGLADDYCPDHFRRIGVLPETFSPDDLTGRKACRQSLQMRFNLPEDDKAMIVVWSSRLALQKGIDLVIESMGKMLEDNPHLQFIFIADGEERWVRALAALQQSFPGNLRFSSFEEELEIMALAGGDVLLMPSSYEPCGLNQMKAQKLGCVPLVHETGGLTDTVSYGKTGFSFLGLTVENLTGKMRDAAKAFQDKALWEELQRRILALDYSWSTRAQEYEDLYIQALS